MLRWLMKTPTTMSSHGSSKTSDHSVSTVLAFHSGDGTGASNLLIAMARNTDIAALLHNSSMPLQKDVCEQMQSMLDTMWPAAGDHLEEEAPPPATHVRRMLPSPLNETKLYWGRAQHLFDGSNLPSLPCALLNNTYFPHTGGMDIF